MKTLPAAAARRLLVALLVLLAGSLALTAARAPALGWTPNPVGAVGLAADGTPAVGRPLVIVAKDEPRHATPSGEQTLRIAGPIEGLAALDPSLARDLGSAFLARQVFRGLTRLDTALQPVPELAARIEISADGLTYTFMLRPNATFQDGRPITAGDVVFSLTHALDPATAGGEAALLGGPTYLSDIAGAADLVAGRTKELAGARAVDDRTVRITLAAPRATFLMKLAAAPASVVDPKDVARGGDWWRSPNGSGPFKVTEWKPEAHLTLTRFDGFFAGPPPLARIEVQLGPNASSPFNLYQAGDLDVSDVPISAVDRVMDPGSALRKELTVTPLFAVDYIAVRTDTPPMDDPHIRRAIQIDFPRDKVATVAYDGHVNVAPGLIPREMLGRDWPVKTLPYDPAAARREVAASTYGSVAKVPPLRIYLSGGGSAESLRDTLQADLGLKVEVIAVDWPEFLDGLSRRSYPAYELYWGADYPDPESLLGTLFGSRSADNYVGYQNPTLDGLLRQAAAEPDETRRADLYAKAQQALLDDGAVIPLYDDVGYTLAKPYVKGLEITPLGILRLDGVWLEH